MPLQKYDIRKAKWYEEISEYFGIDEEILKAAVPPKRLEPENEPPELKNARETIRKKLMSNEAIQIHNKILTERPEDITDIERSASWKDYVFVCINGERSSFQRQFFYDQMISCVIKPMLETRESLDVMDYGCGSSLFTRMLSQDFRGRVRTISADVCKPAVEFSVSRNRLYSPNASGILIDDVHSFPEVTGVNVILAHAVFEHLPNSTRQIQAIIDTLAPGGVLIENYAGHSGDVPHKSDTFDSYTSRDRNLDLINDHLTLLHGSLPEKRNGVYERHSGNRIWIKDGATVELVHTIKDKLSRQDSFFMKAKRKVLNLINK